jgi:hypothetical protein
MQALDAIDERMKAAEDGQISLTDPDAPSMQALPQVQDPHLRQRHGVP